MAWQTALYILGPPILIRDGKAVELDRRKSLALFIYLIVSDQPHSRDALATLFWPKHGQSQARTSLRKALSDLVHSLGERMPAARTVIHLCRVCHRGISDAA